MYSATESKELKFHFLHKDDLSPIGYDKVRKDTGENVDAEEIVRGFEIEKGKFVPLEDDDLDRLDRSASRKWSSATRSISPLCARTKACSY